MKNYNTKRYCRISVGSIFTQLLLLFLFIIATQLLIIYIFDIPTSDAWRPSKPLIIIASICYFFVYIPVAIYIVLDFYVGLITIDDTKIYSKGDIRPKEEKLQYPASVDFINIVSVKIIPWQRASNGKSNRLVRPVPFLEIKTKHGRTKTVRFALYFMSYRFVRSLLNEIIERCEKCGNPIELDMIQAKKDFINARFAVKEENI